MRFIILLLLLPFLSKAQDLIKIVGLEPISCKITRVKPELIEFVKDSTNKKVSMSVVEWYKHNSKPHDTESAQLLIDTSSAQHLIYAGIYGTTALDLEIGAIICSSLTFWAATSGVEPVVLTFGTITTFGLTLTSIYFNYKYIKQIRRSGEKM
ncbi:MAG: hypothetical protein WC760_06520 [Bacteroidia bacterium]|jgi:hypothetical protein